MPDKLNYYVLQVKTGGEERYLGLARNSLTSSGTPAASNARLLWPRRRLRIRKRGKERDTLAPIFPGYVFLETDELHSELYWTLKRVSGFYKFLKDNHNIEALSGEGRHLLLHFLSFGEVVEKSGVYFDENKRIRVLQGALKGLEGRIVKVDRRKKRAKVRLALYEHSFLIDFGFELLEPAESHEGDKT